MKMENMDPLDRLLAAISILQLKSLASDSLSDGERQWGNMHMRSAGLDHAIQLLISIIGDVETLGPGDPEPSK